MPTQERDRLVAAALRYDKLGRACLGRVPRPPRRAHDPVAGGHPHRRRRQPPHRPLREPWNKHPPWNRNSWKPAHDTPAGGEALGRDEIAALLRPNDLRSWGSIALNWAIVFGSMALVAAWPNPLTVLLALVLIGARQLGFAVIMHEASHRSLFLQPAHQRLRRQLAGRLPGVERSPPLPAPTTCSTTRGPGPPRTPTSG